MATENLFPDGAVFTLTLLTGAATDVDESPDVPDANWLTASGSNQNTAVRASLPSPTGDLNVGAGLQRFRAWVRKTNHSTDGTAVVELWETGGSSALATVVGSTTISSTSGQMLSGTWDASLLAAIDGSGCEIRIAGAVGAGPAGNRSSLEVGAIEWTADYSTATIAETTGTAAGTSSASGSTATVLATTGTATASATAAAIAGAEGFPVVASFATTGGITSVSPGVEIAMPSGIIDGDLLLAFCANDTSINFSASGWTKITEEEHSFQAQLTIFAKIADGGDSMTLVGEVNDFAVVVARITGHSVSDVATDIFRVTPPTEGDSAAPDPPSLATGASAKYLWLECFGADDDHSETTYWSANYTSIAQRISQTDFAGRCTVAVAYRALETATEDPGAMALTTSNEWVAQTLAIPPAVGGIIEGDGNSAGTSIAGATASAFAQAAGASSGVAASAVLAVALTLSAGSSAGVASVSADSGNIVAAVGSSAAAAVVDGQANAFYAASFSADGVATLVINSAAVVQSTAVASGAAIASASGEDAASGGADGLAVGVASVTGSGATVASSGGQSDGLAAITGISSATAQTQASAQGVGSTAAEAAGIFAVVAAASGIADALADGADAGTVGSDGQSVGLAAVAGIAGAITQTTASADGISAATAIAVGIQPGDAVAIGTSVAAGISSAIHSVVSASVGLADVAGQTAALATTVAEALGASSVAGVSAVASVAEAGTLIQIEPRIYTVPFEPRIYTVPHTDRILRIEHEL